MRNGEFGGMCAVGISLRTFADTMMRRADRAGGIAVALVDRSGRPIGGNAEMIRALPVAARIAAAIVGGQTTFKDYGQDGIALRLPYPAAGRATRSSPSRPRRWWKACRPRFGPGTGSCSSCSRSSSRWSRSGSARIAGACVRCATFGTLPTRSPAARTPRTRSAAPVDAGNGVGRRGRHGDGGGDRQPRGRAAGPDWSSATTCFARFTTG